MPTANGWGCAASWPATRWRPPVLVGLGVDELSLDSAGIPRIKAIVRGLDSGEAQALAQKVLAAHSAAEVRALVKQEIPVY